MLSHGQCLSVEVGCQQRLDTILVTDTRTGRALLTLCPRDLFVQWVSKSFQTARGGFLCLDFVLLEDRVDIKNYGDRNYQEVVFQYAVWVGKFMDSPLLSEGNLFTSVVSLYKCLLRTVEHCR